MSTKHRTFEFEEYQVPMLCNAWTENSLDVCRNADLHHISRPFKVYMSTLNSNPVCKNWQVDLVLYVTRLNSERSYFSVTLYISFKCTASIQNYIFLWCVYLNTYEERTSPLFISSVNYRFVSAKKKWTARLFNAKNWLGNAICSKLVLPQLTPLLYPLETSFSSTDL